ncbi:hypothetical protein [Salegentibacter sp. F14]
MMNKFKFLFLILFSYSTLSTSQSNELSNSPYSYFGLGLTNKLGPGKTNALGKAGIALSSVEEINNLNPASLAAVPLNDFFYDVGLRYQESFLSKNGEIENKSNGNFSSLSIALPLSPKSGLGISLLPFTNVGYTINGIETDFEGTEQKFFSIIEGYGGLNDFKVSFGTNFSEKLRMGASGSLIFGTITEKERSIIQTNAIVVREKSTYVGARIGLGLQYDWSEKLTGGLVINSPSELYGGQVQAYSQVYQGQTLEGSHDLELQSFYLPLEVGIGIETRLGQKMTAYLDYKRNFWNQTDQSDKIGDYVDQDLLGVGLEYSPGGNPLKYLNRMKYRGGFEYDSGNLEIGNEKVQNVAFSLGLGFPINPRRKSMINFHYSYGKEGQLSTIMVQENFHLLSVNLSLHDIWFVKRKFD